MPDNDAFQEFVNGLDVNGVEGINCNVVHPLIDAYLDEVYDPEDPDWFDAVTPVQGQVRACLLTALVPMMAHALDKIDLPPDEFGDETPPLFLITLPELAAAISTCITMFAHAHDYVDERINT